MNSENSHNTAAIRAQHAAEIQEMEERQKVERGTSAATEEIRRRELEIEMSRR